MKTMTTMAAEFDDLLRGRRTDHAALVDGFASLDISDPLNPKVLDTLGSLPAGKSVSSRPAIPKSAAS